MGRKNKKAAKDAMAQILINSRMCAQGHRPICQDTGMVCAFVKVGMDAKLDKILSLLEPKKAPRKPAKPTATKRTTKKS